MDAENKSTTKWYAVVHTTTASGKYGKRFLAVMPDFLTCWQVSETEPLSLQEVEELLDKLPKGSREAFRTYGFVAITSDPCD